MTTPEVTQSPIGSSPIPPAPEATTRPGRVEFVAMMAMLMALVAFSIDSIMPALPRIASELSPDAPNTAQLVITSFVLGMGLGTLVAGPLSDQFGRRSVIVAGVALYIVAAVAAVMSATMEALLLARFAQGLGAAGPRVTVMAVVRDLHAGRGMAQITSFIMMVFSLVPALAPLMGAQIIDAFEWRAVFWSFALFGMAGTAWYLLRLDETLPKARRRPFRPALIRATLSEMLARPDVRLAVLVQALCFAGLVATISTIQPVYDDWLGRSAEFPLWFGATALVAASASYLNARLVVRLGMRRLVRTMLGVHLCTSLLVLVMLLIAPGVGPVGRLGLVLFWQVVQFFMVGMTLGNLTAIAMEPMGHVAGTAASLISAVSTVLGVVLAVPVGLTFDGGPLPLVLGCFAFSALALLGMLRLGQEEA
ncbi:multidrug effflux MFS transporter [Sagittula salina]|uniref:Bcr/CflA family efflux transporter n=1 Tax=Sagittula salina TaxID=2820268 RepID=A0A940S0D9_9RHOB|nr:multidrug effflux MFS transporter [Sagittula salina]MBP0482046.1 multidrug effflux MFS transporter [Sagittula salina]